MLETNTGEVYIGGIGYPTIIKEI